MSRASYDTFFVYLFFDLRSTKRKLNYVAGRFTTLKTARQYAIHLLGSPTIPPTRPEVLSIRMAPQLVYLISHTFVPNVRFVGRIRGRFQSLRRME